MAKLRCIICHRKMANLMSDGIQPDGGLAFASCGHYGSQVFDPMDGSFLELCICDACLSVLSKKAVVFLGEAPRTVRVRSKYKVWDNDEEA